MVTFYVLFVLGIATHRTTKDAMREHGVHQIGNVRNWHSDAPDVFIASAVANVSMASLMAAKDVASGSWKGGTIITIGLENPDAVSLPLAPQVSQEVHAQLEQLSKQLAAGDIEISTEYNGPEFPAE